MHLLFILEEYFDTVFIAPELREEVNHVALQAYGMEEAPPAENFSFPEKKEEQNNKPTSVPEETIADPAPETANAESQDTEAAAKYSDDDIPF